METILIDIVAWAFFHIAISLCMAAIPSSKFEYDNNLYRIREWEKSNQLWSRLFQVKKWKHLIPDGTKIIQKGFEKKSLISNNRDYLFMFLIESRRAELTHWLSILPSVFFFLWNPLWAGWVMVVYALLFNMPIIIAQRYNRNRLERILSSKRKSVVKREEVLN
ncbi:glycosyl-4,4'-diaponeurosporenoate acyltransferase [Psychrobacillus sp. BL-248-WT-3]|uniref:glycosyl-4,4'-diaponeurosporenoate acyltransferase CrtO family protein n=1 Tax=Psychrobacillus sp. BL-248-WT-3 TaxID=2725306 RepID=UPI00146A77B4|nr:glycosyl-4,4'-diaponeurosporenoate acyltransferase [Psychrobacillus sp. BL-248-WT-3]NME07305.1 glycosyl-4,4'-diaponeurosporenoate acyltransferase [Psychrobacillus sp. BL-248-WT-3]